MSRANNPTGQEGQAAAGSLRDTASEVGENLRNLGSQVRDQATEKYENVRQQANEYYEQGREDDDEVLHASLLPGPAPFS